MFKPHPQILKFDIMSSLSRRERREYAKKLGLLSKKESYTDMAQRFGRTNNAGNYLHTHHVQEVKNSQLQNREVEEINIDLENLSSDEPEINPFGFLGKK